MLCMTGSVFVHKYIDINRSKKIQTKQIHFPNTFSYIVPSNTYNGIFPVIAAFIFRLKLPEYSFKKNKGFSKDMF